LKKEFLADKNIEQHKIALLSHIATNACLTNQLKPIMTNKIILLITLITSGVIVSQPFMYLLALNYVLKNLQANTYIEVRKLIDTAMNSTFRYTLYTALLANIVLVAVNVQALCSLYFITAAIALVCLVADVLLAVKGNIPINKTIGTWSADNYPNNWTSYRDKWFDIFKWRSFAAISAFISLLIGAIFGGA
jgi:hypothetical protein